MVKKNAMILALLKISIIYVGLNDKTSM
ncbi:MAG: hypothetical protein PWP52_180, partial [Bacteroidales bacterium]|nr:hypothetical protein [Bacteroidales bacterium]